jgi:hypothetical protein
MTCTGQFGNNLVPRTFLSNLVARTNTQMRTLWEQDILGPKQFCSNNKHIFIRIYILRILNYIDYKYKLH